MKFILLLFFFLPCQPIDAVFMGSAQHKPDLNLRLLHKH